MKPTIVLLIIFFSNILLAQDSDLRNNDAPIWELKSFLANEERTQNPTPGNQSVRDLLHRLQPSVYFFDGRANSYGERPTNLFTDKSSINSMTEANFNINHIKIVTVKIKNTNDLNSTIDLNVFSNFRNLQYVYILSEVPATEQDFKNMIRNNNGQYKVFYKIDRGENIEQ